MYLKNKDKENRTLTITVRFRENDKKRIAVKAEKEGLDLSTYIRHAALKSLNE